MRWVSGGHGALAIAAVVALLGCRAPSEGESGGVEAIAGPAAGTIEFGLVAEDPATSGRALADYPHWDSEGGWAVPSEAIWTLEQPLLVCRIEHASRTIDALGFPAVDVALVAADGEVFEELTRRVVGRRLAVLVGGRVVLTPRVVEPLTRRFVLSGRFSEDDVRRLLEQLEPASPTGG